jgi:tetratricopeptide (TPR) repeat protein
LAEELAMSRNNRGALRRAQGKLDAAMEDFEYAIKILTRLVEQKGQSESVMIDNNRGAMSRMQVKLVVAIGYSENAIEVLTRTRVIEQDGRRELAVALATSLKNRGYASLVEAKVESAIGDFEKAVEIYARLVGQQGQKDLAPQFAKSLNPIAWIYATTPNTSFRNGSLAKEYALKACQLSEWKSFVPVETLAAACAETGNFADAITWQQKALELAPGQQKIEVRSRLELYKSGSPYRAPLPKRNDPQR